MTEPRWRSLPLALCTAILYALLGRVRAKTGRRLEYLDISSVLHYPGCEGTIDIS